MGAGHVELCPFPSLPAALDLNDSGQSEMGEEWTTGQKGPTDFEMWEPH